MITRQRPTSAERKAIASGWRSRMSLESSEDGDCPSPYQSEKEPSRAHGSALEGGHQRQRAVVGSSVDQTQAMRAVILHGAEEQALFKGRDSTRLRSILTERGTGSGLRGWRRELDLEGSMEASYPVFCSTVLKLGFVHSTQELTSITKEARGFGNITLTEAIPQLGALIECFRKWMEGRYTSYAHFFDSIDKEGRGYITKALFLADVLEAGFAATESELSELFACCDIVEKGLFTKEDCVFLEGDPKKREAEVLKLKKRKKYEHEKFMVRVYKEEAHNPLPASNRLAMRPWMAKHFEELPAIERQRITARERGRVQRGLHERVAFIRHVRQYHGNEIVAWRRGLDPHTHSVVSEADFRKYCRLMNFKGNIDALYYSLDPDNDGTVMLEQISAPAANVLASFREWAHKAFGSCLALWDSTESVARRRHGNASREGGSAHVAKNMPLKTFHDLLKAYGCPSVEGENGKAIGRFIFKALDYYGCGFIFRTDCEWLDLWKPTEWLVSEPDEAAWTTLRSQLLRKHGHMLRAWRFELDKDNSNRLSWKEFHEACERIRFQGDLGGAWRYLDTDLSGWISLTEVDEESSNILTSFKEWADTQFGTVQLAFKGISVDGKDSFNYGELRNACAKFKWLGDTRLLFDCLALHGDTISYRDASFLTTWAPKDEENVAASKAINDSLWFELLLSKRTSISPSSPSLSRKSSAQSRKRGQPACAQMSPTSSDGHPALQSSISLPSLSPGLGMSLKASSSGSLDAGRPQTTPGNSWQPYLPEAHCSPRSQFSGHPYSQLLQNTVRLGSGFPRKRDRPRQNKKGGCVSPLATTEAADGDKPAETVPEATTE